ncbi:hypothetical protein GRI40_06260 [Altererythrobacter aerius]|uniref:Uncharacterized protein n=1 Tax=Tsuneonella aeria TaxID=1837929 RepID=A0A6I4TC43_9SPHN|nr:hypothetical protein [Tsuneonella aeria]MXO74822.1 hypothetical protein [Tsuneonella aeria]
MKSTTTLSGAEFNSLFGRLLSLQAHLRKSGADKHSQVDLLINAGIAGGLTTGTDIVGVLVRLGFDRKHAGIRLKAGVQHEPDWPYWGRLGDGTYYAPDEEQSKQ